MTEYTGQFIQANDLKMHYYDVGKGYPILMIHGGSGNALDCWGKHFLLLSDNFRIIAPDSRGHGKTNNPKNEFSYNLMAQDIIELMNVLNLDKPIICGWSDGGQIALELGIHYPHNVKALIMGGTFSEIFDGYIEGFKTIGVNKPGVVDFEKLREVIPEFVDEIIHSTSEVHGKDYWKPFLENISKMWSNPNEFPKDLVKNINLPTLIISGDKDQFVPLEESIKLHKMISGSNLAIAPDTDHFMTKNRPKLFFNLIKDFLQENAK